MSSILTKLKNECSKCLKRANCKSDALVACTVVNSMIIKDEGVDVCKTCSYDYEVDKYGKMVHGYDMADCCSTKEVRND